MLANTTRVPLVCLLAALSAPALAQVPSTGERAAARGVVQAPSPTAPAVASAPNVPKTDTRWYREAGFGLFIHWGLYAQAAGEWKGKRYFGIVEHLMRQAKADPREYIQTLGSQFDPTDFDAAEWVAAAKGAGVRYIIITSKHHDGFAMFNSAVTKDDIVDATPFKRDVLKELARECAKAGIRLGFYYSHVQDWSGPDGDNDFTDRTGQKPDFNRYMDRKALPQVRELMRNYGKVAVIWYDTPRNITKEQAQRFRDVVKQADPSTLVTSRIGQGLGDIRNYGDSEMPDTGDASMPWEAIYTHNDSWGFSKFDQNFKTSAQMISTLAVAASRGGNMVLNVGPDAKGSFPRETKEVLAAIGAWTRINGESIFGTSATAIRQPWGVGTAKPGALYLHILHRPLSNQVLIPNLAQAGIKRVATLAGGRALEWRASGKDVIVTLPANLAASPDAVLKLTRDGELPKDLAPAILSADFDQLTLVPATAEASGAIKPKRVPSKSYYGVSHPFTSVEGMKSPQDQLKWQILVPAPGVFNLEVEYSGTPEQAGQQGAVGIGSDERFFEVVDTGRAPVDGKVTETYRQSLGGFRFTAPGIYAVTLRPEQTHGELFTLKNIVLTPKVVP